MLDWVAAAVESTKAAVGITKVMVSLRDEGLIQERVSELNTHLMGLQQQVLQGQLEQIELIDELRRAKQELHDLKEAKANNEKYQRHQFARGGFAYRLRPEFALGEIKHYLCSSCFEAGKHVTLHRGRGTLACPSCKVVVLLHENDA